MVSEDGFTDYGLQHMETLKALANGDRDFGEESVEDVKSEIYQFNQFRDNGLRHYMASAGMVTRSYMEDDKRGREKVFNHILDALASDKSRLKHVKDMLVSPESGFCEPVFDGVPETELRKIYESLEVYPGEDL